MKTLKIIILCTLCNANLGAKEKDLTPPKSNIEVDLKEASINTNNLEKEASKKDNDKLAEPTLEEALVPREPNKKKKELEPIKFDVSTTDEIAIIKPFDPKALGPIPKRWTLKEIPGSFATHDKIKLNNGETTKIKVSVYRLTPDEKKGYISIIEPGYNPVLGTDQTNTIGAIVGGYSELVHELEYKLETTLNEIADLIAKKENLLNP